MSNLSKQLKFFHDNKDDLLRKYGEKFIVVSPGLKVDAFDSEGDAYLFGCKEYGLGNFLLKDGKTVLSFRAPSLERIDFTKYDAS